MAALVSSSAQVATETGQSFVGISKFDKVAAIALGLYGFANLAQGVDIGSADTLLRPLTLLMLPTVLGLGLISALMRPERLRGTWPLLLLVVALLPTFGQPTLSGTYFEADASPARVLLLICLPLWSAAVLVRSIQQVDYLLGGLLFGSLAVAVGLMSNPVRDQYNAALQAGEVDTITTGVACAMGALILLAWALRRRGWAAQVLLLIGALALGYSTLLTMSRQATVILAVGVPLVVLSQVGAGLRRRMFLGMSVLAGAYVIWFGVTLGRLSSTFNRPSLWAPAQDAILSNPLGVGWGNYFTVASSQDAFGARYPHNILLQALLEGGLAFGIALLAILVWAGLRAWRLRKVSAAAILGVVWLALLLSASVSSDITGARGLAVLTGALIGLAVALRGERPAPVPPDRPWSRRRLQTGGYGAPPYR